MKKLLELPPKDLTLSIRAAAEKMNLELAMIEKDLWVCIVLEYLFSKFKYKDAIVFKGGTTLSKVYGLIERFSEDIDLALDWKVLGYGENEPYDSRSNTKQLKFNEKLNKDTEEFLRNEFLPILENDFKEIAKGRPYKFYIQHNDGQTIML